MMNLSFFYAAFLISLAGGVGAVARLYLGQWKGQWMGRLPLGILLANVVGSLIVGLLSSNGNVFLATILITGLAGGLSTFSSLAANSVDLMRAGRRTLGIVNVMANLVLSCTAVVIGQSIAATLLK